MNADSVVEYVQQFWSDFEIRSFLEICRMIFWPKTILKISKNDQIEVVGQKNLKAL